jgi:hypothetical protein
VTLSIPGEVLETLIMHYLTSSIKIVCRYNRWPVPFQSASGSKLRLSTAENRSRISVYRTSAFSIISSTTVLLTSRGGDLKAAISLC